MKVLVTGGSGRIGRYVVRELVDAGHEVTTVDVSAMSVATGCRSMTVDLTDAGQVFQSVAWSEAEAVVHLGAWANAGLVPDTRTYGDNTRGTYHVFQACADLGVRRVVSASSGQVYGLFAAPPLYLPLDEEHPLRPVNCYALSKIAGEQAADYFTAQYGLEILSFRFMGVRAPQELGAEVARLEANRDGDTGLLWTRTDARDAASACRLGVETANVEAGAYNVTGTDVVVDEDAKTLVDRCFGSETEAREQLAGRRSPMTCARAERLLGYRPRFVWSPTSHHPEED